MSKLLVLNDAIEKLEAAENALGIARRAFTPESMEYDLLDGQFEVVGDAVGIVKEVLAHAEQDQLSRASSTLPPVEETGICSLGHDVRG